MTRVGAAIAVVVALVSIPRSASAVGHRRVAVLEYRGGVAAAPEIGQRLADRIKKTAALDVVDPLDARRRDPRIDAEVAKCAGDPDCTARIGSALDTDEVLLVAMSQLGDLVLAVQRVDVESGKVKAQLSEVVPEGGELGDAQLDGWLKRLYPPEVFKRYGFISVKANVDGALVSINGQERGRTPLDARVKVIAPRTYEVELAKKGHVPFSARIDVVPDAIVEVNAQLPEETERVPWYRRWYPWAILGAAVAGAGVGAYFYLTRPDAMHDAGFLVLPSQH